MEPTRTEYCLPARIQGDSVRLKNIVAGSSKVLIYSALTIQKAGRDETAHKHKDRAVLAFTAPVLCGVRCIAHVVGLKLF